MYTVEEKGPNPSSCQLLSPHQTTSPMPTVVCLESTPNSDELTSPFEGSPPCDGWPEFTFITSYDYDDDDLVVDIDVDPDLLNGFSSANDNVGEIGMDDDHDLFSAYIDMKKLEENELTNNNNNNNNNNDDDDAGLRQEDNLLNGGGFVVESCVDGGGGVVRGRGRRGGGRWKRKEKSKNGMKTGTTPTIKKQQSRSLQSCLTAENGFVEPRKAMASEELAELWSIDPKRAKRIVANRHSAARSKERKAHYMMDLEENVKKLNSQVAFLNSRLTANQKETTELAAVKSELKCQLQSMEYQSEQIDAQIEALKQDIEWLRSATWEMDSFQSRQSLQPTYFQFPPLLQNCQQSMVAPYLQVANSQPLF